MFYIHYYNDEINIMYHMQNNITENLDHITDSKCNSIEKI